MDAVVLVAGMGGMTGSYASPEIAYIAKQCGLTIWAVVTKPFGFEGERCAREARKGIDLLTRHANAVICVNNQDLIKGCEKNTTMGEAFRRVDVTVAEIVGIITEHGELTEELLHQLPRGFSFLSEESGTGSTDPAGMFAMTRKTGDSESARGESIPDDSYCSFCGKHRSDVKKLISGPSVFICSECVEQCVEIIAEGSGGLCTDR